jgi:hypothetical protein
MIKPYPMATLAGNRYGHLHAWPGKVCPQEINGRSNFQVDGKDSPFYCQSDSDREAIFASLPADEVSRLRAGFIIRTHFFSDEYFGA